MDEEGSLVWTNTRLIIRNDPQLLQCVSSARSQVDETLNGVCGFLSFEKFSRQHKGLRLSQSQYKRGTLGQHLQSAPGDISLSECSDFSMPEELTENEMDIPWMPLVDERGVGFPVHRIYHEYIVDALGSDVQVRIGEDIPIQYVLRNRVEAVLMPYRKGLVRGELEDTRVTMELLHASKNDG